MNYQQIKDYFERNYIFSKFFEMILHYKAQFL
jgi:hypothetical protein